MKRGSVFSVLKQAAVNWMDDKAPMHGAALAYYTIFSLAPLLILSIAIAGFVLGREAAQGQIFDQMRGLIGTDGARSIQDVVQSANAHPSTGIFAAVTGILALLFGASGVFGQLQTSLNVIWGVEPRPGQGIIGIIKNRFLSFSFILVVGFLLLVSLILSAGITFVSTWVGGISPTTEFLAQATNLLLSLGITTFLFALIFKYLPDATVGWRDVWIGAFLTALLFSVGKFALGIYLGTSSVGSSFGAAGSLIVLLVWVYYSAQILFFGAEFTQAYADSCGARVQPSANAVAVQTVKITP
jgi:membrane protein